MRLCTLVHISVSLYRVIILKGEVLCFVCMHFCPSLCMSLYHDIVGVFICRSTYSFVVREAGAVILIAGAVILILPCFFFLLQK